MIHGSKIEMKKQININWRVDLEYLSCNLFLKMIVEYYISSICFLFDWFEKNLQSLLGGILLPRSFVVSYTGKIIQNYTIASAYYICHHFLLGVPQIDCLVNGNSCSTARFTSEYYVSVELWFFTFITLFERISR